MSAPGTAIARGEAPRRGNALLQRLGAAALRLFGWRITGEVPAVPRFVAVVAPHTSNWDFPIGVFAMFALDLRIHWFGKDTLFRGPARPLLRWLGGRPVRRDTAEGVVGETAATMNAEPQFILALAPEGTRRRVAQWRTGFYHVARAAGVPILPVWIDWSRREVGLGTLFAPSGHLERDLESLKAHYRPEMARDPRGFWR